MFTPHLSTFWDGTLRSLHIRLSTEQIHFWPALLMNTTPARALDLTLPLIDVFQNYYDSSKSKVPLAEGLFGKVIFEPWSSFEKYVDEALLEVLHLDESAQKDVDTFLCCCRKDILGV